MKLWRLPKIEDSMEDGVPLGNTLGTNEKKSSLEAKLKRKKIKAL
jgi:hypothetical protein